MAKYLRLLRILVLVALIASLSGCEQPRVYGSVGVSSFSGGWGGTGVGGSISIGGRIF
ncbi:MAG: hypothetical protein QNJ73_13265 [Gammaproteobacteria bacterium]|nr:hypothetical protein [Gammaproteobacteria bacterium]